MEADFLLNLSPNPLTLYALVFLLGSLSVASLSDIKRMAAQPDFFHIWALFVALMFASDLYIQLEQPSPYPFAFKYLLILLVVVVSTSKRVTHLATMDVFALAALFSAVGPDMILFGIPTLLLANEVMKLVLSSSSRGGAYPFLPTVFVTNLVLLALSLA